MGMRYRRPNRRRHQAPYPAIVQNTAVLLALSPVFLIFVAVAPALSAAMIFMALTALLPWEQWVAGAAAMPKPEAPTAEPAPTPTIVYSARKVYGRRSALVSGHYRRTKSGCKVWVRRHYRRG